MNLSDNLTHLIASIAILAAGVVLIIFGHSYVDPAYVFGTCFTLLGALLGYKFGAGGSTPSLPDPPVVGPGVPVQFTSIPVPASMQQLPFTP